MATVNAPLGDLSDRLKMDADGARWVDPDESMVNPDGYSARLEWEKTLADMDLEGEEAMAQAESDQIDALADALLEKIKDCDAGMDAVSRFTARRMGMIERHAEEELGALQRRKAVFVERLFFGVLPGMDLRGKKSKKLPNGTVGTSQKGGGIEIVDQEMANSWATKNGLELKTTDPVVLKTPIVDYLKETGDLPEVDECGWRTIPTRDEPYIK